MEPIQCSLVNRWTEVFQFAPWAEFCVTTSAVRSEKLCTMVQLSFNIMSDVTFSTHPSFVQLRYLSYFIGSSASCLLFFKWGYVMK